MMKKKLFIFLFVLAFAVMSVSVVLAADVPSRLVDEADLLTSGEEAKLLSLLNDISEKHKLDVVVVTVDSLNGRSARAFADDYYDENGYGYGSDKSGVLLLVSMETREWHITTTGYGIRAFTDKGIDYISDRFLSDLSAGYYADAFETYAELCDDFIAQAKTGTPYGGGHMPAAAKEPFAFVKSLAVSLVIGFVVAFLVTSSMKAQLKTVRSKAAASDYLKKGSLQVTDAREFFLYRHVSRRRKANNNRSGGSSTHRSSSGTRHGGGGGRF